jgi:hypothetical protein
MKEKVKYLVSISALILSLFYHAVPDEVNLQFATQRNLLNPRFSGLSNSGVAIPEDISSATLNPSLVHCWHFNNKTRYSGTVAYARDSLFSRHSMNLGGSCYINEKATLGTIYRYLKNGDDNFQNEIVFNFAGRLFDKSIDQGAVNLGFNLRYENLKWKKGLDSLQIRQKVYDDSGYLLQDTLIKKYRSDIKNKYIEEGRLLFDFGFFQDNILKGLDFGLTFHSLFGYNWHSEKPVVNWSINDSTVNADTVTVIDSSYYKNDWEKDNDRNKKVYRRMTIGLSYHPNIIQNKVSLLVPFDLEFIGIFDRKQDTKIGIHTGIEARLFSNKICLRFGYAYAPKYIIGNPGQLKLSHEHLLSGGIGVYFERIAFNVYMRKQDWGIGSVIAF